MHTRGVAMYYITREILEGKIPAFVLTGNECIARCISPVSYFLQSSQKATAEAAATLRLSTPWYMGMRTT